jgi:putative FmdB family regulatory protein
MPTYEYECQACGHTFEKFQSMTARPVRVCPACHKRNVRRLIGTGAGVIFKGSGFYETDYRRKSKPAAEKPAAEKPASTDSAAKKSELKSDADTKKTGDKNS